MMFHSLAETVMPMSLLVIVPLLTLIVWGRWATLVDDDARYYYVNHKLWNSVQLAAGVLGFALWFLIPIFLVGMVACWALMIGAALGYNAARNREVPETERWSMSNNALTQLLTQRKREKTLRQATLKFVSHGITGKEVRAVPIPTDPHYAPHLAIEELLLKTLDHHGQRIEIAGDSARFRAVLSVDGVSYPQPEMSAKNAVAMIDYLKAQCGMDVEDRRKRASGRCSIETIGHGVHELAVHTAGSTKSISCVVLIDPKKNLNIELKNLGLTEEQFRQLEPVVGRTSGLVLVATPQRQGRTTLLYSLVRSHDPYMLNIHTIEQTAELSLEGVHQNIVEVDQVPKSIRSLLLQEPDVLMVSNMPDEAVAKEIAQAQMQRTRIYAGLRADDTFKALLIWLKAVGDTSKAVRQLDAIVSQRLVRTLCETCSQAYKPDEAALKKLNLPPDRVRQLYKSTGKILVKNQPEPCPNCQGLGYRGRVGALEVMVLDDEARHLILKDQGEQLRAHLRRNKMMWLQESALAKAVSGKTSVSEVMRSLGKEK